MSELVKRSQLPRIIRNALPNKKQRVSLGMRDGAIRTFGTWWDGGSRAEYWLLELETGKRASLAVPTNPLAGVFEAEIEPRPGFAVLRAGITCGQPATPQITVWTFGDDTLGRLQLAYLTGDCPWGIVADRLQELGMLVG